MKDPIDKVEWVPARKLWSYGYNPNFVFHQEMRLLEESILLDGWTQPVIRNPDFMIVDGHHRTALSLNSLKLQSRYAEEVPTVLVDLPIPEAMMMTVRMNRAKGQHSAQLMSDLVKILSDEYSVTPDEMMKKMGMTLSEVDLLLDGSLIKRKKLEERPYSNAWVPVETRSISKEEVEALEKHRVKTEPSD